MTCQAAGMPLEQIAVTQGLARATAPGRFQRVTSRGKEWVVDGAHNAEAAAELVSAIQNAYGSNSRLRVVFGMVKGHDAARLFSVLAPVVERMELVPIDYHRSMAVVDLAEVTKAAGLSCRLHQSLDEGLGAAADADGPILVTGSFYLAGEALRALT
jgi:dihydrofolate synthase/folylpolyglutamate synthase